MIKVASILCLVFCNFVAAQQILVDPTRPYLNKHATVMDDVNSATLRGSNLRLTAIFSHKERRHAVINGKLYSVGQTILGHTLLSIDGNKVILQNSEGKQEFLVNNNINIKKDIANGF
jgi:hypothetical protein